MAIVTMRQMLDSGVHFGHQTRRWNPKMKRFILTERNSIYIIDLAQTVTHTDTAFNFVKNTVAKGGTILFIGTKKQAQEAVAEQAARVGMPYVNQRWLGGMLTNFQTVSKRLARLKELEEMNLDDASTSAFTKKELLMMRRERDKLARTLGGIRTMSKVPAAVWIVDTKKEHLAVDEARKLGLPIVAILDTNADPDEVDYPIPGNDDAIRSVALLTRVIADAVAEGLLARHAKTTEEDAGAALEPMAEWERELLAGSGTAESDDDATTPAVEAAVADANTSAVASRLDTTEAEELAAPDAVDPATSFPAETPAERRSAVAAEVGAVPQTEVTSETGETPLVQPVAEAAAKEPVDTAEAAADAKPAAEVSGSKGRAAKDTKPAKGSAPVRPAKDSKPAKAAKSSAKEAAKPAARVKSGADGAKPTKSEGQPMANYSTADIKALRERTGAGMMDVKKALDEAGGDADKAVELLRIKGLKGIAKREGRATSDGLVAIGVAPAPAGEAGVMVEVNSETDFVAKSPVFVEMADKVLAQAVAQRTGDVEALLASEVAPGEPLSGIVDQVQATVGERLQVRRVAVIEGETVTSYLHKTNKDLPPQVGVLVATDKAGEGVAKDIAMHIAAYSPLYVTRDDVPADKVQAERHVAEEITRAEGKPEAAVPRIVEGRLNDYFKDTVLVDQAFAKNPKQTVGQVLKEAGATVTAFARFRVGA